MANRDESMIKVILDPLPVETLTNREFRQKINSIIISDQNVTVLRLPLENLAGLNLTVKRQLSDREDFLAAVREYVKTKTV